MISSNTSASACNPFLIDRVIISWSGYTQRGVNAILENSGISALPLLFALYVNELPSLVSISLSLFADDIKLY